MKEENEQLIQIVKSIISNIGMTMSLRQIYYQLVGSGIMKNHVNNYKRLSRILVEARKKGIVDFTEIEDRTRGYDCHFTQEANTYIDKFNELVSYIRFSTFSKPLCISQDKLMLIGVEKQSLEPFFRYNIPDDSNVMLIVCKGYNSLSQLYSISEKIKSFQNLKEIHMSYFGDHDPTGFDIPRNLQQQLEDFGIELTTFNRIAVNKEQIKQYKLPTAPAKPKDSRSVNWKAGGCVEVDAIPPKVLANMVKRESLKHWDQDKADEIDRKNTIWNDKYRELVDTYIGFNANVENEIDGDDEIDG